MSPPSLPSLADARPLWRAPLAWLLGGGVAAVVARVLLSPVVMWDQAEQVVWSQTLAWGYGPQPPLYTWVQWAVNQVLGPTVLALALVKFTLMGLTFVFMALAARQVLPARTAWLAALGMWWLPGMGWQVLRDLTHTVLLTCAVAATWWLLLRQVRAPRPAGFAWLGLALGVGVLSKYSYVLFAACALVAALSLPAPRRALCSRGWWLAPLVAAALVAPHALWVLEHWQLASGSTLDKLRPPDAASGWRGMLAGLKDLAVLLALVALPWALMAVWAFGLRAWRTAAPDTPDTRPPPWAWPLLARYLLLVVAGLLAMVLLGRVSSFNGRWLHPLACVAPLAALVWRPQAVSALRGQRRYFVAVAAMALLMWSVSLLDPLNDARRGRADRFNWPVAALADRLRAAGYDGTSPIIVNHHVIGGVLRMRFPGARLIVCVDDAPEGLACVRRAARAAEQAGQRWWLLTATAPAPPAEWWAAGQAAHGAALPVQTWDLPLRWAQPHTPRLRIDVVGLPGMAPAQPGEGV
ncbi:MAG: glycosyltransferase family 39 protein [Pseudomonadota bacterium]|nr:glycosyltransferase family 39 protein [Pseudomonadota bacterium]